MLCSVNKQEQVLVDYGLSPTSYSMVESLCNNSGFLSLSHSLESPAEVLGVMNAHIQLSGVGAGY